MFMDMLQEFKQFIEMSLTCYHVVENAKRQLVDAGAIELDEKEKFNLVEEGAYVVTRNGSSLIAFQLPKNMPKRFHIYAAHSDSPCFKIKENPDISVQNAYQMLNVEAYGGMIMSSWMDRPLAIAGRVVIEVNGILENRLVSLKDKSFIIPNLAIHMNREVNKGKEYNVQKDMLPLYSVGDGSSELIEDIANQLKVKKNSILGTDLFLCVDEEVRFMGTDKEYMSGPRFDDLECVFAGMKGMEKCIQRSVPEDTVNVLAVFDNEEVGSSTKQGAGSTFLRDILERIQIAYQMDAEEFQCALADSLLISADNAHALHPNYIQKADPNNRPYMNQGIVIKYHGGQNYTTDAYTAAYIKQLCSKADLNYQTFTNRSDERGGSTLGKIAATNLSIPMVDIGLPQLAMHSAYETAGVCDLQDIIQLSKAFYQHES